MSSWHYAFMFPPSRQLLCPEKGIRFLAKEGFRFDPLIYEATVIDDFGHLEYVNEATLNGDIVAELACYLKSRDIQTECCNDHVSLTIGSAMSYVNPYIMAGWPRRAFGEIDRQDQESFLQALKRFAAECNAAHMLVVDDPPDFFEDRFLEIDGRRVLERRMASGREYEIRFVWRNPESGDPPAIGTDGLPSEIRL